MVALVVLNFAGIFCFGSSLVIDCKIEVGIFMIDWLFYQQLVRNAGGVKDEMFLR